MILRVGGIKLCLVRIDQATDDGPADQPQMATRRLGGFLPTL
jgi:hypothetical protein